MGQSVTDATETLEAYIAGDAEAINRLVPLVYDKLRRLARSYMQRESKDATLQPTALVHEAYMRLINGGRIDWRKIE